MNRGDPTPSLAYPDTRHLVSAEAMTAEVGVHTVSVLIPEETGLLLIDCDMYEEQDIDLLNGWGSSSSITLYHCSIVKEGSDDRSLSAIVQMGYFILP